MEKAIKFIFLTEKENYDMKVTEEEKKIIKGLKVGTENEVVANRFSGEKVELTPEAVALYDLIMGCELILNISYNKEVEIRFYTARDIFIKNWPKEYKILLD